MTPTPPDDPTPNPASLQEDPELIAYLDGELGAEDSRTIESEMALDKAVRAKAEEYKKTYDLLDYLPKPEPSATFASRTLTKLQPVLANTPPAGSVSSLATSGLSPPAKTRTVWPELFAWIVAALALGGAGYFGHLMARPYLQSKETDKFDQADLPLIHDLPLYLGVDDLEFVQKLREADVFEDEAPSSLGSASPDGEKVSLAAQQKLIAQFQSYTPARQQQLRTLHTRLAELPAKDRAPLHRTLEGYAVWLERLPDGPRKEILSAANGADRFDAVLRVRERIWRESLPASQQKSLKSVATVEERTQFLRELKQRQLAFRQEWEMTRHNWAPNKSEDQKAWPFNKPELAKPLDEYIRKGLGVDLTDKKNEVSAPCRLTREELLELRFRYESAQADGYWFSYGACLLQLAEKYPMLPEPGKGKPITQFDHPPLTMAKVRSLMPKDTIKDQQLTQRFKPTLGRWPEFALEIHRLDANSREKLPPLGPCKPGEFSDDVENFLSQQLFKKLDTKERGRLEAQSGKWPEYPRMMLELAKAKNLSVPGAMLPGEPKLWNDTFRMPSIKK